MNTNSARKAAIAIALTMIASAVIVPSVSAQGASLTFSTAQASYTQGNSGSLDPDTGKAQIKFDWEYTIPSPVFGNSGLAESQTLLVINNPQCDDTNLKVSGAQSIPVVLVQGNSPSNTDSGEAIFFVTAGQLAPGETPISCRFSGAVNGFANGQVEQSNTANTATEVVVSFLGLISANIPTTIQQAGPQKQIKYDMEVRNLGNSLTNVRFELRDAEAAAQGGWNPVAPTPVVLQSESQGGTDTVSTVSFLVSTPFKNGWNNKEKTFTLDITPESTKNPENKGSTVTVNVLARVRGVYVPSLEPMVMVAAVIGAAMVARMSRKD